MADSNNELSDEASDDDGMWEKTWDGTEQADIEQGIVCFSVCMI